MRTWRIGTVSAGVLLIVAGVLWIIDLIVPSFSISSIILNAWPVLLILIGLEVLLQVWLKKEGSVKFDVLSIILVLFVLMASVGVYAVGHSSEIFQDLKKAAGKRYSLPISKTTDLAGIKNVIIRVPDANVTVIGKPDTTEMQVNGSVRLRADNREEAETAIEDDFIIDKFGDRVTIQYDERNTGGIRFYNDETKITQLNISLPDSIAVRIEGATSDIAAENILGGLTIDSTDADMHLKNIEKKLTVSLVNGDIEMDQVSGVIEISTTNGDILSTNLNPLDASNIQTIDGDMSISLLSTSQVTIKARTTDGSIVAPAGVEIKKDESSEEETVEIKQNQGTNHLRLETTNGDITIKK